MRLQLDSVDTAGDRRSLLHRLREMVCVVNLVRLHDFCENKYAAYVVGNGVLDGPELLRMISHYHAD